MPVAPVSRVSEMVTMDDAISRVLSHYQGLGPVERIECLGSAGGFSGACFWRISTPNGPLCLRRWPPEHPGEDRLAFIHRVLCHVANDLDFVPAPFRTVENATWVSDKGCLWELTKWLPGRADYWERASEARLTAAMQCLARFHRSAEIVRRGERGASPGIAQRRELLGWFARHGCRRIARAIAKSPSDEFRDLAHRVLNAFPLRAPPLSERLKQCVEWELSLQPVIRDIWHDHVLFEGDQVTGIVDFGAMALDNVARDVARLLGSLVEDNARLFALGLNAYQQVNALTPKEQDLVELFDQCNVLLGGMNWLRWILLDERQFDDLDAVIERLGRLARRLDRTDPSSGR